MTLDEFSRYLAALLDSRHDRAELSNKVISALAEGDLTLQQDQPRKENPELAVVNGLVDAALTGLCHASLLTA